MNAASQEGGISPSLNWDKMYRLRAPSFFVLFSVTSCGLPSQLAPTAWLVTAVPACYHMLCVASEARITTSETQESIVFG